MYNQQFRYQPAGINQPMLDSSLAFLKQLNSNELESLEKDEARIQKFAEDCEQVRQLQSEKENLMASSKSLAEYNLSRESQLEQGREQLAQTYAMAVEISKRYDKSKMLLGAAPTKTSSDVQLALLQTECAKAEETCEQLATEFLGKKLDVDDFVSRYIEERTLSHVRKVKCDKMAEILRQASPTGDHHQPVPVPPKTSLPAVAATPNFSALINTGSAPYPPPHPYPPYPANSYMPFSQGPPSSSYRGPMSVPLPYPSHPGAFPQPNLH